METGMSIPNIISIGRIFLVPLFALMYSRGNVTGAMGVLLLSAASDVLDGAIARHCHMETELGRALDPIADKLIQAAMMLCALERTPSVWLLLGLHLLRELSLGAMGIYVLRVTGHVYGSKWYGKLCTLCIYTVMICALAFPEIPAHIIDAGVMACGVLVAFCLCAYMINFQKILLRHSRSEEEGWTKPPSGNGP